MTLRSMAVTILASVLFSLPGTEQCFCAPMQQPDSPPDFQQLLQKLASFSPDPCDPPYGKDEISADLESRLFGQAADAVTQGLNANPASERSRDRAAEALKKMERISSAINAAWPEENRFHFQVIDVSPALVVKMTLRTHAKFFVFGIPKEDYGKPNRLWKRVGSDEGSLLDDPFPSPLDIYVLHRGPSKNARFLAVSIRSGCAGSIGGAYDAREWNPEGEGSLERIIEQTGAWGLDDKVPGFEQIGKLRTEDSLITLPYCWFSPIDTWDNPSLCAVDTYDLSGDNVRFRARSYNRPDLLPIAKAIEYAQKRDYLAVLGYCASGQVARRLVRDFPPHVFSEEVKVTHTGSGRERVEVGSDPAYRFDVERRAGRWRVVAFSVQ